MMEGEAVGLSPVRPPMQAFSIVVASETKRHGEMDRSGNQRKVPRFQASNRHLLPAHVLFPPVIPFLTLQSWP